MSFFNSLQNKSKKFDDPFLHWELDKPLTEEQINAAKDIGADIVEIHTGQFCKDVHLGLDFENAYNKIKESSSLASKVGLEVHLGHGITFKSIEKLAGIEEIKELGTESTAPLPVSR